MIGSAARAAVVSHNETFARILTSFDASADHADVEVERDVRPLVVGEAPSRTSDPEVPFSGRPMRWLSHHLKAPQEEIRSVLRFENLLSRYPGPRFPTAWGPGQARALLRRILVDEMAEPSLLVLCGRSVGRAFGIDESRAFFVRETYQPPRGCGGTLECVVVPHPSGLSRWWNDPANKRLGLAFLGDLFDASRRRCSP